ncbi:hypothetical protein JCM5353_007671, partial [Sporobolomyces roseus]
MVNASSYHESPTLDPAYAAPLLSYKIHSPSTCTSTARSGKLSLHLRDGSTEPELLQTMATPGLVSTAPRGAVTHLTPDNLKRCSTQGVHLSLEHFLEFQPPPYSAAPFPLDHFLGLNPAQTHRTHSSTSDGSRAPAKRMKGEGSRILSSMSLREQSCERGQNGDDKTRSVPTNGDTDAVALGGRGVVRVSPRQYLDWTLPRPPDLLFTLADEPSEHTPSKKRLEKSVKRSLVWLDEIARGAQGRTNVFATLVGNDDSARRTEFSKALLGQSSSRATVTAKPTSPIDPLLSGYVANCSSSPSAALLNASLDPLPKTKPRIAHCPSGPHEILRLIRDVGFDLVVEEWSQTCSTHGIALDFDFPPTSSESRDIGTNLYLKEHEYSFSSLSTSSLAPDEQNHPFGPSPPTRSYVHHLLLAHEMTSHVILALHNQIVMLNFFESIRTVLSGSDGEDRFKEAVKQFEEVYRDREENGEYLC